MTELEHRIHAASRSLVVDVDPRDTERALRTFDGRLRQRRRRKVAAGAGVTVGAIAALTVFAVDRLRPTDTQTIAIQTTEATATDTTPGASENRVVYFSDGSHAELLQPRTELRMEAFSEDLLELTLATGEAQFDVAPSSRRLFRVRTNSMRIEVLGTSFTVATDEEEERVEVDRGRVAVYLDGNRHELTAGMRLDWDGERAVIENGEPEPNDDVEADVTTAEVEEDETPPARRIAKKRKRRRRRRARRTQKTRERAAVRAAPVKTWKRLAQDGDFDAAYVELEAAPAPARDDTRELMLAADVARLSGHPREAVKFLDTVITDHRRHPRALLAAFTLGRIFQRELDDPRRAAEAFRTARALGPTGSLAEDALAHEAECWARAGEKTYARDLAAEYLRLYPEGRKVRTMRRLSSGN